MADFRVGVLLIGVRGRTAQALVAGTRLMAVGAVGEAYGITGRAPLASLDLVAPAEIAWGGWDVFDRPVSPEVIQLAAAVDTPVQSLQPHALYPGSAAATDFDGIGSGAAKPGDLRIHIAEFRKSHGLEQVIVVNLSNPPRGDVENPRAAYVTAALEEGCSFVEFTPTDTLTEAAIVEAARQGCHVAGRDGSTGQTFLKLVLADALEARGLTIRSWYSTNVLGNHDGAVLSDPGYAGEKLHDKRFPLDGRLENDANHVVRIDYLPDRDDNKEAWDSIRLDGWLGSQHRLHITWEGADSYLAPPMLLDLVRLIEFSRRRGDAAGLRTELAPFFKYPLGVPERPWAAQVADLISWYAPPLSALE